MIEISLWSGAIQYILQRNTQYHVQGIYYVEPLLLYILVWVTGFLH